MNQHPLRWFNLAPNGGLSKNYQDRCGHCGNSSIVLPDQGARNVAWPCPMCALGRARANEYATGNLVPSDSIADSPTLPNALTGRSSSSFYDGVDFHGLTWEGGLTIDHRYYCQQDRCNTLVNKPHANCAAHTPSQEKAA